MKVKKLRILIADDHGLLRGGARAILQSRRGWRVVGEAANGREAVQKAIELNPDVAVVDIGMPDVDGIEVARQIREAVPDTKVLMLTMHESDEMVSRALDAGARGFVLKSDLTECLPRAVEAIAEGKRFLTPKVSEIVLEGFLNTRSRHQQERRAGPRSKSNKEIATLLGITVRTVETHRAKIMLKLGIHSLAELIHYALHNEIISAKGAW
jgi:DNA-binding NarL/FixJ family response regulator